ncbi:hypothetical protein GCM10010470_19210 [Saccharopolyspora taberi]|uniref:Transglycosylase SLT domain-containing protein n=1 Tax=Saccharopolyspora taberi TaxID=60895 RepID=A0ABN3V9I1_9PSEU
MVTGLLFALTPVLALRGDAIVEPVANADPVPRWDDIGITGRLPANDKLDFAAVDRLETRVLGGVPVIRPTRPGIPDLVLAAYQRAEQSLARTDPGCRLHWSVLAGIGHIESGHARSGRVDAKGTTTSPILGPALNGAPGVAAIPDTDGGALDGDRIWDRAVGPMQFIPSTWRRHSADGNGDGVSSPHNAFDAALASGRYLCSGSADLGQRHQLAAAIFRYNHSEAYVRSVLSYADAYARGVRPTPVVVSAQPPAAGPLPVPPPPGTPAPSEPPAPVPTTPVPPTQPPTSEPPTSQPPTSEPPTSEPPTSQPPTSQPPTSETPPTSEPPTSSTPPGIPERPTPTTAPTSTPPPTTAPPSTAPSTTSPSTTDSSATVTAG